jgi:hypothetical protein
VCIRIGAGSDAFFAGALAFSLQSAARAIPFAEAGASSAAAEPSLGGAGGRHGDGAATGGIRHPYFRSRLIRDDDS